MHHRKIFFIINPSAGKKKKLNISQFIKDNCKFPGYDLAVSHSFEEFEKIKQRILDEKFTDVIACGGDGTVNRAAAFCCENNLRLGILPLGSGNGLARSVKVSMNVKKALAQIEQGNSASIDVGFLNDKMFFCAAGMGFDAHVAAIFEKSLSRGLWGYVKLIWKEFFSYKGEKYTLHISGKEIKKEAFIVACCNSGQYGNDFYIAPTANMKDGKITISLLKPFNKFLTPLIILMVVLKKTHKLYCVETYEGSEIKIIREKEGYVHLDGEPHIESNEINLSIRPLGLEIICE